MSQIEIIDSDDAMVGITVIMTQKTFRKLLKISPVQDMPGWSAAIIKLIDKSGKE